MKHKSAVEKLMDDRSNDHGKYLCPHGHYHEGCGAMDHGEVAYCPECEDDFDDAERAERAGAEEDA